MTGTVAYILSKKIALGAVSGIKNVSFSGTSLVFQFNDGSSTSLGIPLPKDGVSIKQIEIDNNKHLVCTMSDGTTIDAGALPSENTSSNIKFTTEKELPTKGEEGILYVTEETIKIWDGKEYIDMGNSKEASDLTWVSF